MEFGVVNIADSDCEEAVTATRHRFGTRDEKPTQKRDSLRQVS